MLFPTACSPSHLVVYAIPNVLRVLHSCCTKAKIRMRVVVRELCSHFRRYWIEPTLSTTTPRTLAFESWQSWIRLGKGSRTPSIGFHSISPRPVYGRAFLWSCTQFSRVQTAFAWFIQYFSVNQALARWPHFKSTNCFLVYFSLVQFGCNYQISHRCI